MSRRPIPQPPLLDFPRAAAGLGAALEWIGSAAFILGMDGQVHETNSAADAMLARERAPVLDALRDAALQRPNGIAFELTLLQGTGEPHGYLAVLRADALNASARVARAATRWKLTSRQREILDLLARGSSNRTLAAALGITERTVETHLSAIFDKAGAENRAGLLALILT